MTLKDENAMGASS